MPPASRPKIPRHQRPICRNCRRSWVVGLSQPSAHRAYCCDYELSPHYKNFMEALGTCEYFALAQNGRMCQALGVEKTGLRVGQSTR
jgi:hypothetical protein